MKLEVTVLHLDLLGFLAAVVGHKLNSGQIINQVGLGGCPEEGRWSCPLDAVVGVCV